jgi:hypothetical protein
MGRTDVSFPAQLFMLMNQTDEPPQTFSSLLG